MVAGQLETRHRLLPLVGGALVGGARVNIVSVCFSVLFIYRGTLTPISSDKDDQGDSAV